MSSLASLVRLAAAPPLRRLSRARGVDVRRLRPAPARARGAAVRALRRAHGAGGAGLPRLQPAALVHDGALRALAGGPRARARRALEARRDLAGAPGRRAGRARAAAAAPSRRSPSCRRCATACLLRGADPPAELAAELGALVGAAGRARSCAARAACARSADSTPSARRRNVRGAFAARAGPRALALVDDVYTTGATVDECARALRQAGAEQVHVVTLARTPLDRTFARAPPDGRLHLPTYPSGEARDATSGERQEPGYHGADPRVRRAQARAHRAPPDRGHARRPRAGDRAQPLDQRQPARGADRLDAGPRAARPRVRGGHVRGDRPRRRQARSPGAALPRAAPPLAAASPGARHRGAAAALRRRRGGLAGDRQRRASRSCRFPRS